MIRTTNRRGSVTLLFILIAIPLCCLIFFVINSSSALRRGTQLQMAADAAATSAGNLWASGLNVIEKNNAEITLLLGIQGAAQAAKDAMQDSLNYAYTLAAANWWNFMGAVYSAMANAIKLIQPAHNAACELMIAGAKLGIVTRGVTNAAIIAAWPTVVAYAATDVAKQNGVGAAIIVPATAALGIPGGDLPLYPVLPSPVSKLCSALRYGSPSSADTEKKRVYNKVWGWPKNQGTLSYAAENLGLNYAFWPWFLVGGPAWYDMRKNEQLNKLCKDSRIAPALFDMTLNPNVDLVLTRLRLMVVVAADHNHVFSAPHWNKGGDTFADPADRDWGLLATSEVELTNKVSIDGTSGRWDQRLGHGGLLKKVVERLSQNPNGLVTLGKNAPKRFQDMGKKTITNNKLGGS